MNNITIKRELKNIKRDLEYYMNNYELSQKEAYSEIHRAYYTRMMLTKNYVELEEREQIYKEFKDFTGEKK